MKEAGVLETDIRYWNSIKAKKDLLPQLESDHYKESIAKFYNGEYKALHLEKLHNYENLYSIRIKGKEKADRLLFTWKEGERDAYILEVAENHDYKKAFRAIAPTLNTHLNDTDFVTLPDPLNTVKSEEPIPPLPPFEQTVYYGGHLFSLSDPQYAVTQGEVRLPLIINGTAGSGKTVIARQLIMATAQEEAGVAYYFAPTQKLAAFMQESVAELPRGKEFLDSKKIVITTYPDYVKTQLPTMQLCGLEEFKSWYGQSPFQVTQTSSSGRKKSKKNQSSVADTTALSIERIYAEMCIASVYSNLEEYKALGKKQSSLPTEQRDNIWRILESYLQRTGAESQFDPNLQSLPVSEPEQGMVVVDESQSTSAQALKFSRSLAKEGQVLFVGDSSQSMLSSVSNTSFIKSLFYNETTKKSAIEEIFWSFSYRCPDRVVEASSALLEEKQRIAQEKQPFIDRKNIDISKKGFCYFYDSLNKVNNFAKEIAKTCSIETVIIVPNENLRAEAAEKFGTEFVVTAKEFLGIGSPNVVMYRCFEFLAPSALSNGTEELSEESKIAVNALFVAMTRTEKSLTICETAPHKNQELFGKLGLQQLHQDSNNEYTAGKLFSDLEKSNPDDWKRKIIELIQHGNNAVAKKLCNMVCNNNNNEAEQLFIKLTERAIPQDTQIIVKPVAVSAGTAHSMSIASSSSSDTVASNAKHVADAVIPSGIPAPVPETAADTVAPNAERVVNAVVPSGIPAPVPETAAANQKMLLAEILRSDLEAVQSLLQRLPRADIINFTNKNRENYVYIAVKTDAFAPPNTPKQLRDNNAAIIRALIKKGILCVNSKGEAIPFAAATSGDDAFITTLHAAGVSAEALMTPGTDGNTPAHLAAQYGHLKVITALIAVGVKKNRLMAQNNNSCTALMLASEHGYSEIVTALLARGVDVNQATLYGNTALMVAAQKGHSAIVTALLAHGAKVDKAGQDGYTALIIAAEYGHSAIVTTLLENGAAVNNTNSNGYTALILAAKHGRSEIVTILLANGAAVDKATLDKSTALMLAAQKGYSKIVTALLENGAEVDKVGPEGYTAFMIAAEYGHSAIVATLLAKGAEVDRADSKGTTALMLAAQKGHSEIVTTLLAKGANANKAEKRGVTPLILAAYNGHSEIVTALLANGAELNKATPQGKTALMVAKTPEITNTLITSALIFQGIDDNMLINQLAIEDVKQKLSRQTISLLAAVLSDTNQLDGLIKIFNQNNPSSPITPLENDTIAKCTQLKASLEKEFTALHEQTPQNILPTTAARMAVSYMMITAGMLENAEHFPGHPKLSEEQNRIITTELHKIFGNSRADAVESACGQEENLPTAQEYDASPSSRITADVLAVATISSTPTMDAKNILGVDMPDTEIATAIPIADEEKTPSTTHAEELIIIVNAETTKSTREIPNNKILGSSAKVAEAVIPASQLGSVLT